MVLDTARQAMARGEKIAISGKFSTVFDPISEGTRRKTTEHGPRIWTKEPTAKNTGPVPADLGPYVFNHDRGRGGRKF